MLPTKSKVCIAKLHRGSYMNYHVLVNLLNESEEKGLLPGLLSIFVLFLATSLIVINKISQALEC